MARICLVTPGQLQTNPRVVKEADALSRVGHTVHVITTEGPEWAVESTGAALEDARWSSIAVGGKTSARSPSYLLRRARHRAARAVSGVPLVGPLADIWAIDRSATALSAAARAVPADLYIAHYPAALLGAYSASRKHGARMAFDAEDFHAGESTSAPAPDGDTMIQRWERRFLRHCAYVSAASPGIASAYEALYGIPAPSVVLNVFPLSERSPTRPVSAPGCSLSLYWFSQTIGPDRGLEDAIRAMGMLGDPGLRLHLRGVWHPGYREELLRTAGEAGVNAEQIVSHAPGPSQDMVRLASEYDIGLALEHPVSLSRDLCLTNKIFTYILAGCAVAGTETAGQLPILSSLGPAAVSYPPGNAPALAAGLRRWIDERALLAAARQAAWEWGERRYNWDLEQKKFLALVSKALAA